MNHPVIFFDGVCNLCNGAVRAVIKLDHKRHFRFSSLQSEFAQRTLQPFHINSDNLHSIILLENNRIYQKSEAVFRIIKNLKWVNFLFVFSWIPFQFSNLVYDFIAKNRYNFFGKKDKCPLPDRNLDWLFLE